MGGEVQDVEVSALKKTGLDVLAEKILLQAELLELKANPDRPAEGTVIEAKLDKGRGPVATVLVGRGTLRVGDVFVVGGESGKVRALIRSEEHTSELQSLMRISYAVFCLKKTTTNKPHTQHRKINTKRNIIQNSRHNSRTK